MRVCQTIANAAGYLSDRLSMHQLWCNLSSAGRSSHYPYKFVMSRILTDKCVTVNSALVNNVFIILGETVDVP
jgi:hypothetical protein